MQVLIHFFAKLLYFLPFLGQNERDPVEKQPDRKIRKSPQPPEGGGGGLVNDGMME